MLTPPDAMNQILPSPLRLTSGPDPPYTAVIGGVCTPSDVSRTLTSMLVLASASQAFNCSLLTRTSPHGI
jgi:hypothetical protein